jgi:hypothetical protein
MSSIERLLEPGSTELPDCRCRIGSRAALAKLLGKAKPAPDRAGSHHLRARLQARPGGHRAIGPLTANHAARSPCAQAETTNKLLTNIVRITECGQTKSP